MPCPPRKFTLRSKICIEPPLPFEQPSTRPNSSAITLRGVTPRSVMAELFGRVDGCSKGKGGSMHIFDRNVNFLGGHGIVGAHVPIATGVAFAIKYRGGNQASG